MTISFDFKIAEIKLVLMAFKDLEARSSTESMGTFTVSWVCPCIDCAVN